MLALILFVLEILSTNNTITDTNSKDNVINTDETLKTDEGQIQQDCFIRCDERLKYFEGNMTAKPIVDEIIQVMLKKMNIHLNTYKLKEDMEITEEGIRNDVFNMLATAFQCMRYEEMTEELKKIRVVLYVKDPFYKLLDLIELSLINLYLEVPQDDM